MRGMRVVFQAGTLLLVSAAAAAGSRFGLPDFTGLVRANAPAVVNISTDVTPPAAAATPPAELPDDSPLRERLKRFFDESPPVEIRSLGSGFVLSEDGYILTAAHVITDATRVRVRLNDRRELSATVIGTDPLSDVALLKVAASGLPTVQLGDSERLAVGEWVLAIGSPFGFESSATAGIVSAKGRVLPSSTYVPFLQTDVAINPGNSGGPLFNLDGRVVGLNSQIYSRTGGFMGVSFAVPINLVMTVTDELKRHGRVRRGWLGVAVQAVSSDLAQAAGLDRPTGALVTQILPGSPAVGVLRRGDVIVQFDGRPVDKMSELPPMVGSTAVDRPVQLEILRDGQRRTVSITLGELPQPEAGSQPPREEPAQGKSAPGLGGQGLDEDWSISGRPVALASHTALGG